jgi:hypothetical protein
METQDKRPYDEINQHKGLHESCRPCMATLLNACWMFAFYMLESEEAVIVSVRDESDMLCRYDVRSEIESEW